MAVSYSKNNVTIAGNPEASTTLMFGHGFGTGRSVWMTVAKSFLKDYRVVLYDNVESGQSGCSVCNIGRYGSIDAFAEDLLGICHALAPCDLVMIGHSMSALIAIVAAVREPAAFSRLVLLGASPKYVNEGAYFGGFRQDELDAISVDMENDYYAWASGFASMVICNDEHPGLTANFADSLKALRPDIALLALRMAMNSDVRPLLPEMIQPTLIIQTFDDVAAPLAVGQYLHQHIPNSRLKVIEARGHFPHVIAPDLVVKAIKEFLV